MPIFLILASIIILALIIWIVYKRKGRLIKQAQILKDIGIRDRENIKKTAGKEIDMLKENTKKAVKKGAEILKETSSESKEKILEIYKKLLKEYNTKHKKSLKITKPL